MFRWESPSILWLLFLVLVLLIVCFVTQHLGRKRLQQKLGSRVYPALTASLSLQKRRWKWYLQALTLMMMILAWARPQMGQSRQEVKSEGFELVIAMDVSESMLSEDVKPSRLEQAKKEMLRLIDLMPGNKVAVIAFAGNAVLISPITTDPNAVKMYIDSLTPESVSEQGTCIECALSAAKAAFERGGATTELPAQVTRVILLASDGEDHEPGAITMAENLVKEGVRIFTVAYGTEKGGAIPTRDQMGYLRDYKKDKSGQTILTTVKGEELRQLAQAGQGSFYFAAFGGTHVQNLVEDFEKLEKSQFDTSVVTQYNERYQIFLWLALLLAVFELVLSDRKTKTAVWRGRFQGGTILGFLLCFFMMGCDSVPHPKLFSENKKGIAALKAQSFVEAQQRFLSALSYSPFQSEIHSNLGLSFEVLKENDKALQSYKKAEELATSDELKFINQFNQGQLLARENKVDAALEQYQKALQIHPGSEQVKVNIELLLKQQQKQSSKEGDSQQKQQQDQDQNSQNSQDKGNKDQKQNNQQREGQPKEPSPKYKPREFKGELNQNDVNKILGEIKSQEQKIRSQFYKNESKDKPREKDW